MDKREIHTSVVVVVRDVPVVLSCKYNHSEETLRMTTVDRKEVSPTCIEHG
jgi:hypothetical protein